MLALGQKSSTDHHRMSFLEPCRPFFRRLGIISAMHIHYNDVFTSAYVKDNLDPFQTKAINEHHHNVRNKLDINRPYCRIYKKKDFFWYHWCRFKMRNVNKMNYFILTLTTYLKNAIIAYNSFYLYSSNIAPSINLTMLYPPTPSQRLNETNKIIVKCRLTNYC